MRWGGVVLIAAVVLAGCKVDARVEISVRSNGSGTLRTTLTFDADAVRRLGGATSLAQTVPLDDLRAVGWTISPWKRTATGSTTISLAHSFADQADLARRMADLAGPKGVLRDPQITRDRGWFSSRDGVAFRVDLRSPSPGIVRDAKLAARLRAAGLDPAALEAQLAKELRTALRLSVVVHLPDGDTKTYAPSAGAFTTWKFSNGGTDWDRVVKVGIGTALALLATLFVLAAAMSVRRERRRRHQRLRVAAAADADRVPLM